MSSNHRVNVLEKCNQTFVCSLCCDPRLVAQHKPFSTSNASLFLEHLRCHHSSVTELQCIYCCCHVQSVKLVQHIQTHFAIAEDVSLFCPLCQEPLRQHWRHTLTHMQAQHCGNKLVCPHCHSDFSSLDSLQSHLIDSQLSMFHCVSPQCLVKTHNKSAILSHLTNKHNGARCLRVSRQFICAEHLLQNTNCGCTSASNPLPTSPLKMISPLSDEGQLIDLPYSGRVLAKLYTGLDERLQEDLCSKMEHYSKFKVRLEVVDGQKQFVCSTCQYRSVHSLADVRKHILGCHCSVSTSYTRLCLRSSRLDTNNFTLFSDRKLISFANEKLKRTENGTGWEGSCDYSGLQLLDDSEQESGSNSESAVRSNKRTTHATGQETDAKKARMKQRQSNSAKMRPDSPVPEVGPPLERNENFDRVIHLNYSWQVLERLVLGQCPERYLPILKQKMDVYSQHRILLTRRNGKRYFLCSHCPNCSPHGMNDIRKHILGVHARLPERFKSAAMYCSRMNRDNYGLLSDDELLKKNQDMVRWRSNPAQEQQEEDFSMEPLAPLTRVTLLPPSDDHNFVSTTSNHDNTSHNVFLSGGDNGESSPSSLTGHLTQTYQHCAFPSLFTNHHDNLNNNTGGSLSDESSPPQIDEAGTSTTTTVATDTATTTVHATPAKGRSRRSLVLKSKTTNHQQPQHHHNHHSHHSHSNSQTTVVNNKVT